MLALIVAVGVEAMHADEKSLFREILASAVAI